MGDTLPLGKNGVTYNHRTGRIAPFEFSMTLKTCAAIVIPVSCSIGVSVGMSDPERIPLIFKIVATVLELVLMCMSLKNLF